MTTPTTQVVYLFGCCVGYSGELERLRVFQDERDALALQAACIEYDKKAPKRAAWVGQPGRGLTSERDKEAKSYEKRHAAWALKHPVGVGAIDYMVQAVPYTPSQLQEKAS